MMEVIMPGLVCFCGSALIALLLGRAAKADRKIDKRYVDNLHVDILIYFLWIIAGLSLLSVGIAGLSPIVA